MKRRRLAGLATAALVLASTAPLASAEPSGSPSPSATPQATTVTSPVSVTLLSMLPRSPDARKLDQPVILTAALTNTTDVGYDSLRVFLERGAPLTTQSNLDAAIATAPATDTIAPNVLDIKKRLPPHGTLYVTYKTTPQSDSSGGMCLCQTAVYPYALVAQGLDPEVGNYTEIGRTQILVPSFAPPDPTPKPVSVTWIWPLIDRPHRTMSESVFSDDDLAGSVARGGRLDRALAVAEATTGKVRLTIPIDPDLIDSLAVMASPGGYEVRNGATNVKGTGGVAAADWLRRLSSIKAKHDLVLTAYADPDIDAVSRVGLKWSTALDPQVKNRLSPTLDDFTSDLIWPADGVITNKALDNAVAGGASAILLNDNVLPGQNKTEPRPDALSPLPTATGMATALVTDSAMQAQASRILKLGTLAANDQQTLLSELAIRAVQQPADPHFVVLAADRYIDTTPATAVSTILATSGQSWTSSIDRRAAMTQFKPVDRGSLQVPGDAANHEITGSAMASVLHTQQQVTSLRAALNNAAALALLGGFSSGIQRAQSNAWRSDAAASATRAYELNAAIDRLTSKVHLVNPTTHNYSLSSSTSPIVVTVSNDLNQEVKVRVSVTAGRGATGFKADPVDVRTIPANSREKISITTHINRVNRFKVIATLTTPDGGQLGPTLELNVRSTALGGITKTVTFVAAGVLLAALLLRLVRRIRRGYAKHPTATVGAGE